MSTNPDLLSYNASDRQQYMNSNLDKRFQEIRAKWHRSQDPGNLTAQAMGASCSGLNGTTVQGNVPGAIRVESNLFQSQIDKTIESYWKTMIPQCNNVDISSTLLNDCHQEFLSKEIRRVIEFCNFQRIEKPDEKKQQLEQILSDELQRAQTILELCHEDFISQMDSHLANAVTNYYQLMHSQMENLIQREITLEKLNESHEKILKTLMPSRIPTHANRDRIMDELRKRTTPSFVIFRDVVEGILKYNNFMKRQFDLYTCLAVDKFNELSNNCIKVITQANERKHSPNDLLNRGLKHVASVAETRNKEILDHELLQTECAFNRVTSFYNREMRSRLGHNTFSRLSLRNMHEKLRSDCVETIKRVCSLNDISGIPDQGKLLQEELNKSFATYLNLNDSKLKGSLRECYGIIRKLRNVFLANMTQKMRAGKMTILEFNLNRVDALREVNRALELELKKYPHESFEFHKNMLKHLADLEIPRLQAENDKK